MGGEEGMAQDSKIMDQGAGQKQQAPPVDTTVDVMAARPLHRIMVRLNKPADWSDGRSVVSMMGLAGLAAVVWRWSAATAEAAVLAGGLLLLFFLGDLLILVSLPRLRISYGSWKPQFFQLAVLRTTAAVGIGLGAIFIPWQWMLVALAVIQILGTAALIWGAIVEPARVQITRVDVTSDRLKAGVSPIRLLHVSDLHIERLSRREDQILQAIALEKPELIVLTGDYVSLSHNRDPEAYRQIHHFLAQLSAPFGVYATLGTPTVDLREHVVPLFADLAIDLLRGERRMVDLGDGRIICLIGMDCTHHIVPDAADLEEIVRQRPADHPQILLYHSPELMPQASDEGIDLYLCGHTHGGQVRLPVIGPLLTSSQLGRQYVMGLYQGGRTRLYVSRGVGLEGLSAPRVRFLAPPEITLLRIKPTD